MKKLTDDLTGATVLRTLTRKSTLKFGRHADATIQNLLDLNHTQYLRWCYYCCSNISFTEDILEAIYIIYKGKKGNIIRTIEKPGTDPEQHLMLNKTLNLSGDDMRRIKRYSRRKKLLKEKTKREQKSRGFLMKKGNLQAKNQGH